MATPRFSVLLPTRNGGRFIDACIQSVLESDREDIELVVSDNGNEDETPRVVERYATDKRLTVMRFDEPVSVTENWSAALAGSTGDYLLMIGDDDFLLPGYFEIVDHLLRLYEDPECLTYNAYRYIFPGAIEAVGTSYYADEYFKLERRLASRDTLDRQVRRDIVRDLFKFRTRFPLTMQLTLVSRRAVDRLRGGLFKSPFPDHYALGALLLTAETWALAPAKPLIVGVSTKSFGHYFYNGRDEDGLTYLDVAAGFRGQLPGSAVANILHTWLSTLKDDYAEELRLIDVSRSDYLLRQLWGWLQEIRAGDLDRRGLARRFGLLSFHDWLALARGIARPANIGHAARVLRLRSPNRTHPLWGGLEPLPEIADITAFARWLDARMR